MTVVHTLSRPTRLPGAPVSGAEPPEPRAVRIHAPSWRSPRLVIGLLLVFASIVAGARVVAGADQTVPMYAAARDLATGTALRSSDLVVVRLRLSGTKATYLSARAALPAGRVLIRPVGAGEVVPEAALAGAGLLRLRPVTIPIDGPPPRDLDAGGLVDIWASAKAGPGPNTARAAGSGPAGAYLDAERIAGNVEVAAVQSDSRTLTSSSGAAVQILVPGDELQAVLNALANDARIAVLPIPGSQ